MAALLISGWAPGASAESRDPLVRDVPAERPPLRELLTGKEFEARYAAAAAKLVDRQEWERSKAPVLGLRVIAVFPDAQVAGSVSSGDVLARMDGVLLWGDAFPDSESPRVLEYHSAAENASKTLRVLPGRLGVQPGIHWRPELAYLRGRHRDPKWDDLVLVAIAGRGADPDLAETALARAVAAGHPQDEVTDQIAAEIALLQNRPEVASAFAWFAEQALDPKTDSVSRLLLIRVALANHHLEDALRIVRTGPGVLEDLKPAGLQRLIGLHKSRPEGERALAAPSARAEGMFRDPLVPRLLGGDRFSATRGVPQLRAGGPLTMEARTGHFQTRVFESAEPTPDVDLTVEAAVTPDGSGLDHYLRQFLLKLYPADPPEAAAADPLYDPDLLAVAVSEFGEVRLQLGDSATEFRFVDPTVGGLTGGPCRVRVARVGGQAEIFLNGHRVYYGPVPEASSPLRFDFSVTGSKATVNLVEAVELVARP